MAWLAGSICYTAIMLKMFNHTYYAMIMLPGLCAITAWAMGQSAAIRWPRIRRACEYISLGLPLLIVYITVTSYWTEGANSADSPLLDTPRTIAAHIPAGEPIVFLDTEGDWSSVIPYYSDRPVLYMSDRHNEGIDKYLRDRASIPYLVSVTDEWPSVLPAQDTLPVIWTDGKITIFRLPAAPSDAAAAE
jgi:hypothetical protein